MRWRVTLLDQSLLYDNQLWNTVQALLIAMLPLGF